MSYSSYRGTVGLIRPTMRPGVLEARDRVDIARVQQTAVMPHELEPIGLDCREVRALIDDRHVLAGQAQLRGHQATNGPRADNTNLHVLLPCRISL